MPNLNLKKFTAFCNKHYKSNTTKIYVARITDLLNDSDFLNKCAKRSKSYLRQLERALEIFKLATQKPKTYFQQIKEELGNGAMFNNESAGWFVVNPKFDKYCICFNGHNDVKHYGLEGAYDVYITYKTLHSFAKRVCQLINRGY